MRYPPTDPPEEQPIQIDLDDEGQVWAQLTWEEHEDDVRFIGKGKQTLWEYTVTIMEPGGPAHHDRFVSTMKPSTTTLLRAVDDSGYMALGLR